MKNYYEIRHDGINGDLGFQVVERNYENNEYSIIDSNLSETEAEAILEVLNQ